MHNICGVSQQDVSELSQVTDRVDVLVIGGGPGGSTVASILAADGLSVRLFEREVFPREHIGESLLPATMPILQEIGALEDVRRAGFLEKWGATMVWGVDPEPWSWFFDETNRQWPHAYQVRRPEFDHILLRNAARTGVDVREGHAVIEVLFEDDRAVGARYRDPAGEEHEVSASFVVDASGQSALLGRARGLRRWDTFFRNLAVFGYFSGAARLPGRAANNVLIESFEEGWAWVIPQDTGVVSVGLVVDAERAGAVLRDVEPRDYLLAVLGRTQTARDLLRDADLVTPVTVVKDWSYASDEVAGPGWVLVGDAACFVDPLFSSGVHLAMSSAVLAAAHIRATLQDERLASVTAEAYRDLYGTQYRHFHELAKLFYSSNRTVDSYFWEARRIVGEDEGYSPRHAFVRAVAGQPPQGYERAVVEHGSAPPEFSANVRAVEEVRRVRHEEVDTLGASILDHVPVLEGDVRVSVKAALVGRDFELSHVVETEARPAGMPVSPFVAALLRLLDGSTTLRQAVHQLARDAEPAARAEAEVAARQALALLYVDGIVQSFQVSASTEWRTI